MLEAMVAQDAAADGDPDKPLRGCMLDSWYDTYRGVVDAGARHRRRHAAEAEAPASWRPGATTRCTTWARRALRARDRRCSRPGEVGIFAAAIKDIEHARVGDTITDADRAVRRAAARLPAGQADGVRRHVPDDTARYQDLRDALGKLRLNDAA